MVNRCSLEQEEAGKTCKYKANSNFLRVTKTSSIPPYRFVAYVDDGEVTLGGLAIGLTLEEGLTVDIPGMIQIFGIGKVELNEIIGGGDLGIPLMCDGDGKAIMAVLNTKELGYAIEPGNIGDIVNIKLA